MQAIDKIEVYLGDITGLDVDAVVNAANTELAGGGGVDGAIHRAAGQERLQAACREIGGCPTGEVRVTPGFDLPARYIIHAVGPVWHGGDRGEEQLLRNCYRQAMAAAAELGVTRIAFPAISCGVYGYPTDLAAACAIDTVLACLEQSSDDPPQVIFCCFSRGMADTYKNHLETKY